jgi:foldase protein PrsA
MGFKSAVAAFLMFGVLLTSACSKPAATVNGKKISRETLEKHLKVRLAEHGQQNVGIDEKKLREAVIQQLINERLTLDEAAARGITVSDAEVDKAIEAIKKQSGEEAFGKSLKERGETEKSFRQLTKDRMVMDRFIGSLAKETDVTEQEMGDFYKNSPKLLKPARVNMKMAEFPTEEAARAAADELKKTKADFDDYMKKLADAKKAIVSDYGWVSPDFFSPNMAASVKGLRDGQYGGPYQGQKGFYLVRVKEHQAEGLANYDEVKDMIRNTLLQQKRTEAYFRWIGQKRNSSKIVINAS